MAKRKIIKRKTDKRIIRRGPESSSYLLPTIISVEISGKPLNFDSLPKFPMVEMINSSNDFGILNTDMVLGFLYILN